MLLIRGKTYPIIRDGAKRYCVFVDNPYGNLLFDGGGEYIFASPHSYLRETPDDNIELISYLHFEKSHWSKESLLDEINPR